MKTIKLLLIILLLLSVRVWAQYPDDVKGSTIIRSYGPDTLVGNLIVNSDTLGMSGIVLITGNDTAWITLHEDSLSIYSGTNIYVNGKSFFSDTTSLLYLSGNGAGVATIDNDGVLGFGEIGVVSPWTGDGTNVYLRDTTDNVGIGNTNPQYNLDVSGTFNVEDGSNYMYLSGGALTIDANIQMDAGNLYVNGSFSAGKRNISAADTLLTSDYVVYCTANTFAVTLPVAGSVEAITYIIKNIGSGTITINTLGGEFIDGGASGTLTLAQWETITVFSIATDWIVISRF